MRKSYLLIGASIIALAGVSVFVNKSDSKTEPNYAPKELSFNEAQGEHTMRSNEAREYWEQLHKNIHTGQVEQSDYDQAYQTALAQSQQKSGLVTLSELGPDNIGGRTRAIAEDPSNSGTFYAASVSGGVFKSVDNGNNWVRLQGWDDAVPVLSIATLDVTPSGVVYVGAGFNAYNDGFQTAEGIWFSTDGGATFSQVAGTQNQLINKIIVDKSKSNTFYYTGNGVNLRRVTDGSGTANIENLSSNGISSPGNTGLDIKLTPDGTHILYCTSNRVYVSNNGGSSFTDVTGNLDNLSGTNRIEAAFSSKKTSGGTYTAYVVASSGGNWGGSWYSEDNGVNWSQVSPKWQNNPNLPISSQFNPLNSGGLSPQGLYNLVVTILPDDPYTVIFGGIDLWRWRKTPNSNPVTGQFERLSYWFLPPTSPNYVHADNHRLSFTSDGRMLIGNDGGVGLAFDTSANVFSPANRGYNVTQFYAISYGPDGQVLGGTQDNGSLFNNRNNFTGLSFTEASGGDGFECELSQIGENMGITSIYYSAVSRGDVTTGAMADMSPPCGTGSIGENCGSFRTYLRLYEDENDINTQDSLVFIPDTSYSAGETVSYFSQNFEYPIDYVLPMDLLVTYDTVTLTQDSITPSFDTLLAGQTYYFNPVAQDTIMVPDYVQTLFVVRSGTGTYVTRDAFRFNFATPRYTKVSNVNNATSFEWSKDGNVLWMGTSNGQLHRITGFDSAYTDLQMNIDSVGTTDYKLETTVVSVSGLGSQTITDISVDAQDPNRVAITAGGAGGSNVFYSSNANGASPSFSAIDGNLPSYTIYACELIDDPSGDITMVVGTAFGPYATGSNLAGTVTWDPINQETGFVPTYDVRQQWRPWGGMVKNPGEIYIGTFGRGIWTTGEAASVETETLDPMESTISNVNIFPNPVNDNGTIEFNTALKGDVTINIYNIQGKVMKTINLREIASGDHRINFNVAEFATGSYIVTLTSNNEKQVKKFMVR